MTTDSRNLWQHVSNVLIENPAARWQRAATGKERPGFTLFELSCVLLILAAAAAVVVGMASNFVSDGQATTTRASMTNLRDAVMQYYQDMKGIPLPRPAQGTTSLTDSTGMPQFLKELQSLPTNASGVPITVDANGNSILFNPATKRGWRGPYLMQATGSFTAGLDASFHGYGNVGDVTFLDGWGNPIVLQWPSVGQGSTTDANQDLNYRVQYVRLVSAGAPSNGTGLSSLDTVALVSGVLPLMPTIPTPAMPTLANQRGNDLLLFILTQDLYP